MENIDKRWIFGAIAIIAVIVTVVVMTNTKSMSKKKKETEYYGTVGGIDKKHEIYGTVGGIAKKHEIYGTQLRGYPNPCGANGNVSNCPKYVQPTLMGEDRAIYAIHNGTIHDPRLKSRMCHYNPRLLCTEDDTPDTENAWDNINTSNLGPGNELQVAYGYNMRKALIEGGAPAVL